MYGWEREIYTLSVRIPRPPIPIHSKKDERGNTVKDRKAIAAYTNKNHWIALKTHQSNCPTPIKCMVSKIISPRHWDGNKCPAVLRGYTARRHISKLMCDQSTARHPHWHIRHRLSTIMRVYRVTPDLTHREVFS